jgi:hypothetical protein
MFSRDPEPAIAGDWSDRWWKNRPSPGRKSPALVAFVGTCCVFFVRRRSEHSSKRLSDRSDLHVNPKGDSGAVPSSFEASPHMMCRSDCPVFRSYAEPLN